MREKILDILSHHQRVEHLFAYDDIPSRKLRWAKFKHSAIGDEQVILLYDNNRQGFVLTPTLLFYNNLHGRGVTTLQNITAITFTAMSHVASKGVLIKVHTTTGIFRISAWDDTPNAANATANILKHCIEALVDRSLGEDMLPVQEEVSPEPAQETVQQPQPEPEEERLVECRGCAARYVGSAARCEYCGCPV